MNTSIETRRADLAKIHIAKKDLDLDDGVYRHIIRTVGGAESCSAADLTALGRARVLRHLMGKGWKPRHAKTAESLPMRATGAGDVLASGNQVRMIRSIWIQMSDAGAVRDRTEQGLRAWVRSATRRHHPQRAGYSAPEFLPGWVAMRVIENLKQWARRCDIALNE